MDILNAARSSTGPFPHDNHSGWSSPWAAGQRSGIVSLPRDGVSPVGFALVANRRVDGAALRQARLNVGLTLSEVAEVVGVADGARVGAWEHGLEQPRPSFVPKLAKVVNLPVTALLVGKGLKPRLADLRLAKGLTLTELAANAGIPRTTCHRLEQGVGIRTPDQATLTALASALDSSRDAVLAARILHPHTSGRRGHAAPTWRPLSALGPRGTADGLEGTDRTGSPVHTAFLTRIPGLTSGTVLTWAPFVESVTFSGKWHGFFSAMWRDRSGAWGRSFS